MSHGNRPGSDPGRINSWKEVLLMRKLLALAATIVAVVAVAPAAAEITPSIDCVYKGADCAALAD